MKLMTEKKTSYAAAESAVPFGSRSATLDGIRGIAILSVLAFHTLRISTPLNPAVSVWRFFQDSSWAGVDLFFVLSGFLITGILLDSKGQQGYFRNFYARRSLRIMPLYYAVLTIALVILPLIAGSHLPEMYTQLRQHQIWLWLYLQNYFQARGSHALPGFGHFWTLAVEEQFYWFWPLIVFFSSRKLLLRICVAVCVLEPVLRFLLLAAGSTPWAVREFTFTRMDSLLYGAIAAILVREGADFIKFRILYLVAAACATAFLVLISIRHGFILYEDVNTVVLGYSAVGIVCAVFILACVASKGQLARTVSSPVLAWFGRHSYALYIIHPALLAIYETKAPHSLQVNTFPAAIVRFAAIALPSCAFAWLSWELIEKRFLRLKKYFEYQPTAAAARSTAAQLPRKEPLTVHTIPASDAAQSGPRIFVHTPEPTSSPALYVSGMLGALTADGVHVHLVCPSDHQALPEFESNPLVTVHLSAPRKIEPRLGMLGKLWRNGVFLFSSCWVLFTATRKSDVVHFQYAMHLPFAALFFACAWIRTCNVVFTAHDPVPHKWLLSPRLRWIERGALAWMYKVSDVILVHSEAGRRTILGIFQVDPEKVRVIVHGPYELGTGALPTPKSEQLEVLMFGALRENKGPHLAIQAVQRLYQQGVGVRLTVAGRVLNRKEQDYWDNCRKLIEQCPEPIHLIERFIPDQELPALFSANHCFILPYGDFHSDSGVAFMALANGRPVLTTPAGGLGQLLTDSQGGLRIESATLDAVEDTIRKAVDLGPQRLEEMGRAGMNWVLQECGWPKVAIQTREVYESLSELPSGLCASAAEGSA